MALQHLRSSTANKRPTPGAMSDGQLALNTNLASPGLFFKDSNGDSVKIGPVHVGTTAPNVTPGAGGQAGNSKGEQWLDTSSSRYVFKIWDGTAWRSEDGEFVNVSGDTMTGALGIIAGTAAAPGVFFSGDPNTGIYSPGADQVAVATNGAGRLFVGSAGDVGIGIGVPTAQLHVVNVGATDSFIVEDSGSDATPFRIDSSGGVFTGSRLVVGAQETYNDGVAAIGIAQLNGGGLNNSRTFSHIHWGGSPRFRHCSTPSTTLGTHTISALSNVIGAHEFYASDGVNFIPSASIQSTVDATPSVGVVPGNLTFSTAPAGTLTERLRITSAGLVGIGTSSPTEKLTVSGNVSVSGNVQAASINNGPLAGMRNAIINGNFDHWQRGTSFTNSEYGADRWFNNRLGTTHTVTRQAFTLGQTDVPGEPTYFYRAVVSSVAGAGNYSFLIQFIEDVRTFAGQQVTISFWAKADATKNIAVELVQGFGSGGSPSAAVNSIGTTKVSIGTTFQKVTVTATVPSISGKTLGTNTNSSLGLFIWFDAGSNFNSRTDSLGQQSGTFEIAQVQLEPGPVVTPFERRPIGTELALCQRYYCETRAILRFRSAIQNEPTESTIYWPQQMRVPPSITIVAGSRQNAFSVSTQDATVTAARFILNASAANTDTYALNESISASAEL